jgi:hypothetical protein
VPGTGVPEQLGSVVEEASPHLTGRVTDRDVPSDIDEIGISDGSGIPSTVVVGGPPTVVQGMGVP